MTLGRNHLPKNRFGTEFLPFDRKRVILQPVLGEVVASNINANVLKVHICILYFLKTKRFFDYSILSNDANFYYQHVLPYQ